MSILSIRFTTFDSSYQELRLSELTSVSSYALLVLVACCRYLQTIEEFAGGVVSFRRTRRVIGSDCLVRLGAPLSCVKLMMSSKVVAQARNGLVVAWWPCTKKAVILLGCASWLLSPTCRLTVA